MPRKSTRGAQGAGTVRQRPNGRWEGRLTVGRDPVTGKQIQRSIYASSQSEAVKKMREAAKHIDDGLYVAPDRTTVEQWLHTWFDVYFLPTHRTSTATVYDININTYLIPALGRIQLQKLRVEQIQAFVNKQNEDKQPSSVHKMIEVLRAALKQAVKNGLLMRSPCDDIILPKKEQKEVDSLTDSEKNALLTALPDTDNARALRFILSTGLRVSELCGLRWADIEDDHFTVRQGVVRTKVFDAKEGEGHTQLSVNAPKFKAGMRQIPIVPQVREILQQQRMLYAERKIAAGAIWHEGDFVFCAGLGTPKDPANLRRTLRDALKKAGLKHRGVHALRHTFATNAIHAGVDVKTLGELIGHSKAAFTIQTYVHSNMDVKKRAMEAINKL